MFRRWVLYLLAWLGCVVFYCAYRQWFAWLVLVAVLALPVVSLVLSLPSMVLARLELDCPEALTMGDERKLRPRCRGALPLTMWRCHIRVERLADGWSAPLKKNQILPTEHCGVLRCSVEKARVYDCLGLFGLPLRGCEEKIVHIRPKPVPAPLPAEARQQRTLRWRPKRGGGYSENHELRLYRPGDNVQQIHWKLSAKTGRLILREPQIPDNGELTLRLKLSEKPEKRDAALGQLLYIGQQLLERGIRFRVLCQGMCLQVHSKDGLRQSVDKLLAVPADPAWPVSGPAIGGDSDEG